MNHVLYGASIPFTIAVVIYLLRRGRANIAMLVIVPLLMAFMATWAVMPDIPRALGFQGLYMKLHSTRWINIFLWHYDIDQVVGEGESAWFPVWMALEAAALMAVAIRQLFIEEKR